MPITRFQIRNEGGLADPALYLDADKDDPEALLEGVAMAGLVGVLRQLGDLAEFAAEIFHDLHEEILATAARGHGLMTRVQQIEAEVPSIERAFLSQTDHSSRFNHAGVDWHPNLHIERNLVSSGGLPRFIMDSCEGCRGPPRLFLLDKFDIAGDGACLKRYTDPSIFKVENSKGTSAGVQIEKWSRKVKKKRPHGTNGGVHEVLLKSNTKLHQLFLEESSKNIVGKHSHRAKLKRGLNGFPFDKKNEKSYMDKLLNAPSTDHEVTIDSSPPGLATHDRNNISEFEVLEVRSRTPHQESVRRLRCFQTSLDKDEFMVNPSVCEPSEVPKSYPGINTHGMPSNPNERTCEKVIGVDGKNHGDWSFGGYLSDDIVSEVDNFVDAPSTMDSEIDSESDFRLKSEFTSSHTEALQLVSDPIDEHLQSRSLNPQSTGDFAPSEEGHNSSRKEQVSCFASDSPSYSVENIPGSNTDKGPRCQKPTNEEFPLHQLNHPVFRDTGIYTDAIPSPRSDVEHPISGLDTSMLPRGQSNLVGHWSDCMLTALKSDQTSYNMDDEEKKVNLVVDLPCSPRVSNFQVLSGEDSPKSSIGEYGVDESTNECILSKSTDPDNQCHKAEGSVSKSFDLIHEVESEWEDKNLVEEIAVPRNNSNVLAMTTNCVSELDTPLNTFELNVEFVALNGDDVKAMAFDKFDDESDASTDYPVQYMVDVSSLREKRDETSVDAQAKDAEHQLSPYHALEDIAPGTSGAMGMRGTIMSTGSSGGTIIPVYADPKLLNEVHLFLDKSVSGACESQSADMDFAPHAISNGAAFDNIHLSLNLDDLVEMGNHVSLYSNPDELEGDKDLLYPSHKKSSAKDLVVRRIADSDPDELGNGENLLSQSDENSSLVDNVFQENSTSLISGTVCVPLDNDDHKPEVPDTVPNLCLDFDAESPAEPCLLGREQESLQQSGNHISFPISPHHDDEELAVEEKEATESSQIDEELLHPGDIDTDLSCLFPIRHSGTPDLNDHIGGNISASSFSPVECKSLSSTSKLPLPSSHCIDINGCPEDPSGSISPQVNPFSGKSLGILTDLPQLPPLPPVQWRIGKIHPAPYSTKEEMMKNDELSRRLVPQLTASTDDVRSSILTPSDYLLGSSTLTTGNDRSAQLMVTAEDTCCPLPTSIDHVGSSPSYSYTDDTGCSHEDIKHSDTDIISETVSKPEKVENSCYKLDDKVMQETSDLSTRTENKHQQFDDTTSGSECISVAEIDESKRASQPVKQPLPRNPLVEDITVLDRSKLRKVVERVMPQLQKVDERDAFLEQIRTKSFHLKPATSSRPSIRGPNTNLKVAAILEKANAIRQALTGSDEDDDSWSD